MWSLSSDYPCGYKKPRAFSVFWTGTQWFWTGAHEFWQDELRDSPYHCKRWRFLFVCFELVREEGYKQNRFFSELNNISFKFKKIHRTSGKPLMNPSAFACWAAASTYRIRSLTIIFFKIIQLFSTFQEKKERKQHTNTLP